ncbi:MAG: hypothetical protein MZV63_42805 [Marinilabiliales bacterium]|nr:hypothetical protein [Marinilabiliales bacterium]
MKPNSSATRAIVSASSLWFIETIRPEAHTGRYDINHRNVHHRRQLVYRDELGDLEDALFEFFLVGLIPHSLADGISLVTAVLGHLRLALAHEQVDVPDVLVDIFLVNFRPQGAE